jgi:hypothetical protein
VSEISLVVKHLTSGGRVCPHIESSEIVHVIQDGVERKPTNTDFDKATFWLMGQGFKPAGIRWLDPTGMIRRRQYTYTKEA